MVLVFIIWACLALVVGAVANTRGRSGIDWFVLAFLISPLLALIFVLVLPDLRSERLQKEAHKLLQAMGGGSVPVPQAILPNTLSALAAQKVAVVWVAVVAGMLGLWAVAHFL